MKILADSTDILLSPISKFPGDIDDFNPKLSALSSTCHGFWYQILLIVPSVLFVAYLAFNARKNYKKLSHGRSYIIIANYALLCSAAILNLAWCSLQVRCSRILNTSFVLDVLMLVFHCCNSKNVKTTFFLPQYKYLACAGEVFCFRQPQKKKYRLFVNLTEGFEL